MKIEFENVNLIRKIVWSFHKSTGLEWDDLFQEACLAYLTALKTYDEDRGKITTHLWWCITNHLTTYLTQQEEMKCKKYNDEFGFLEDEPKPQHAQIASPFWESLSEEAQIIADIILQIPKTYVCLTTEEVEQRIIETLRHNKRWSWPMEKIEFGLRDLKRACAAC